MEVHGGKKRGGGGELEFNFPNGKIVIPRLNPLNKF